MEQYRSIENYKNYTVSNYGNVMNTKTGKILKPQKNKRGGYYLFICLYDNGQRRDARIHNLAATAFLGPCPLDTEVHHKDFDNSNNQINNLQYMTREKHRELHCKLRDEVKNENKGEKP